MNIFADFQSRIQAAITELNLSTTDGSPLDLSRMTVEPPRDSSHGDIATNAALLLAKTCGVNPRALAERIVEAMKHDADVDRAEIAGPGFVNLSLSAKFWQAQLQNLIDQGANYGRCVITEPSKVNVEYVSANPTGPMHVGHCRGAVVGDALANLLAFAGHDVTKEYYINDAGAQIDVLAKSVLLRYREALGEDIGKMPDGLYPGDYLVPVGQKLAKAYGQKLNEMDASDALGIAKNAAVDAMMAMIRQDLAALNVRHDVFFSERSLHENKAQIIREAINDLTVAGHVYRGTLPPPKGEPSDDWEGREQLLFRSTAVGDDMDRPLMKSDGDFTYFAADVAYYSDKFNRHFDQMIYILGADHGGYVKRLEAVSRAVAGDKAKLTVLLCQLVKLMRNGEPVKMSKRNNDFITLREVVDEVGVDAVRFMMLYRKAEAPLEFDFVKVKEQSKDNAVFYVQYASARCHSIFRQADESFGAGFAQSEDAPDLSLLTDQSEIDLVRLLASWPRQVEIAARAMEPHRIAFYLYDVASAFHAHWNKGNDRPELRFVKHDDPLLTRARLGLVHAVGHVLTSGLGIIGVDAPTEMR